MSNKSSGWVASHRSIKNHWLNDNSQYYRWWDIMIKTVNHCDHKMVVGNGFRIIKRGQSALSKIHWRDLLSNAEVTIGRERFQTFLNLLIADDMITCETIRIANTSTTLTTITNYGHYQDKPTGQPTRQPTGQPTTIEQLNNENNKNNSSSSNTNSSSTNVLNEDKKYSTVEAYEIFNKDVDAGVYKVDTAELKKLYKIEGNQLGSYITQFYIEQKAMGKRYESGRDFLNHFRASMKFKIKF